MTAKKTKHQQILEHVRQSIISGTYKAGDRLPTDGQLMRQFGTSRPTVARAMRDLEMEGYLERRAGSGSFVRVPAQNKPSLIGILMPEVGSHELFQPIASEIALQCQKHNLSLLWADNSGPLDSDHASIDFEKTTMELCQRYISLGVAGVFFCPVEFSEKMLVANREIAERLDEAGISVVLLDRDIERLPKRSRFDLVGIDNFRAGYLQADHLIKLGSKRIAYVSRDIPAPTIDLRISGFRQAILHASNGHQSDIFLGDPNDEDFVTHLLRFKPDAIVASNDTTAAMLLRSLMKKGISVPKDIRMIGVDDVKISSLTSVPLTSLRQPCRGMGSAAVNTMIRRIENRKMIAHDIFLDVELIVRDSCGANQ